LAYWGTRRSLVKYSGTVGLLYPAARMVADLSGSSDNTIKDLNPAVGNRSHLSGHSDAVMSITLSPDGQTLLVAVATTQLKFGNLGSG